MTRRLPARIAVDDLVIRLWTAEDAPAMRHLIVDSLEHLRSWMAWAANEPLTPSSRLRLFEHWHRYWLTGDGAVYAIYVAGELAGGCAMHRRVGPTGLDIGYWLGSHMIGRGIGTQTAAALCEAAFAMPDILFVQISHAATNHRSAAIPQRLGFTDVTPTAEADATIWRLARETTISTGEAVE